MAEQNAPRVLVIDDDRLFLEIVRFHLEQSGLQVEVASDPHEGVNRALESRYQLILLDLMMPSLGGEEVLSLLKPLGRHQRVAVVSAHADAAYRSRVRDLGAIGFLPKPINSEDFCRSVWAFLEEKPGPHEEIPPVGLSSHVLDRLGRVVFDGTEVTTAQRVATLGVVLGLAGVVCWLLLV